MKEIDGLKAVGKVIRPDDLSDAGRVTELIQNGADASIAESLKDRLTNEFISIDR